MNDRIKHQRSILNRRIEEQYELLKSSETANIFKHVLVTDDQADFKELMIVSLLLFEKFKLIEILPIIHIQETTYRKKLLPNVKQNKNPDFRLDGEYWELECPKFPYRYINIDTRLHKRTAQADNVILYFKKHVNSTTVKNIVKERMKRFKKPLKVIVIINLEIVFMEP